MLHLAQHALSAANGSTGPAESVKLILFILTHEANVTAMKPAFVLRMDIAGLPDGAATNFQEVCGQEHFKRALEVAAGGCHNVLMLHFAQMLEE